AVGFESGLQRHDHFAVSVFWIPADDVLALRRQHVFERRLFDGLAGVLVQLGLHVEAFDVADSSAERIPDYGLGARRKMRFAIRRTPTGARRFPARDAVAKQYCRERESGETHAGVQEEGTSSNAGATARS